MPAKHSARISARQLFIAVLIAVCVCTSFSSAAKCQYKKKASGSLGITPATDSTESDTSTITAAPTVVEAEADDATEAPTGGDNAPQSTTPAPAGLGQDGSMPAQNSVDVSTGQGSSSTPPSSTDDLPSQSSGEASQTASSSATTGHAPFGDITSKKGDCVVGNPNTYISTADLDDQWDRRMSKYVPQFNNLIFDQIVSGNASLSYCVRWDSTEKLSKTVASKFEAMISRQMNLWNHWLVGYDCWPYEKIDIKVVSFAVRDVSLLDWSDDSLGKIYEGVLDADGIPKCPDECWKHQNKEANADTSACKGDPFDMSLWPSTKVPGENVIGAGGDWGQRVELKDMLATMDDEQMMVLSHEIGHGFGLPDFYEPTDKSATFPISVMNRGPAFTDADGWMLRRVLENIKSRYDF